MSNPVKTYTSNKQILSLNICYIEYNANNKN